MTKCVHELKRVIAYRDEELGLSDAKNCCAAQRPESEAQADLQAAGAGGSASTFLALCLSSRRNMCINPVVMAADSDRDAVDSMCRDRTASWVRGKATASGASAGAAGEVELCSFYEEYSSRGSDSVVPSGIYALDDLKDLGQEQGWCPYFLARHVINHAKVSAARPSGNLGRSRCSLFFPFKLRRGISRS